MPFVETEEDALAVVAHLLRTFDAEKVDLQDSMGAWESVIQLKTPNEALSASRNARHHSSA